MSMPTFSESSLRFKWNPTIELFSEFKNFDFQSKTIAEVGARTCELSHLFLKKNIPIVSIEKSKENRSSAELLLKDVSPIDIRYGEPEKICLSDDSVDVLFFSACLAHSKKDIVEKEILRVLRPEGIFIIYYFEYISSSNYVLDSLKNYELNKVSNYADFFSSFSKQGLANIEFESMVFVPKNLNLEGLQITVNYLEFDNDNILQVPNKELDDYEISIKTHCYIFQRATFN